MPDEHRTTWHAIDNPALAGLPDIAAAQVVQQVNCALMGELVEAAGGEVILPPGFDERVGSPRHVVLTRFLDDGSYRVWTEPLPAELNEPSPGTMWERMAGPRRLPHREVWGVVDSEPGSSLTTLRRIDPLTGEAMPGKPLASVPTDSLRRGVGGWRRYKPTREQIDAAAAKPL